MKTSSRIVDKIPLLGDNDSKSIKGNIHMLFSINQLLDSTILTLDEDPNECEFKQYSLDENYVIINAECFESVESITVFDDVILVEGDLDVLRIPTDERDYKQFIVKKLVEVTELPSDVKTCY